SQQRPRPDSSLSRARATRCYRTIKKSVLLTTGLSISERKSKRQLHQPRLVLLSRDLAQRAVGCRRHRGVRRTELRSVEQIERFRANRQIHVAVNRGRLRDRKIRVVDTMCPQIRVHTRRVTKLPPQCWIRGGSASNETRVGHGEAARVEPSTHAIERRSADFLVAVRILARE